MSDFVLDMELSKHIASRIKTTSSNNCWINAFKAIINLPQLSEAFYVEGWAVSRDKFLITEHSWLQLNGKIIDPSIEIGFVAYFPGISLNKSVLKSMNLETKDFPLYSNQYHCSHQGYSTAYQQALKYIRELTLNRRV